MQAWVCPYRRPFAARWKRLCCDDTDGDSDGVGWCSSDGGDGKEIPVIGDVSMSSNWKRKYFLAQYFKI